MSNLEKLIDALDDAEEDRENAITRFLKMRGWQNTCQTPGSFWLWTKRIEVTRRYRKPAQIKVDGRYVPNPDRDGFEEVKITYDALCTLETAVSLERAIINEEAWSQPAPEDEGESE